MALFIIFLMYEPVRYSKMMLNVKFKKRKLNHIFEIMDTIQFAI